MTNLFGETVEKKEKKAGMSSHQLQVMRKDEWLTPPSIIKALGEFDLDPCAPEDILWKTAKKLYTKKDDGLKQDWKGRVWLNPPYGQQTIIWMKKLAEHNDGIALIFARTETKIFFETVWNCASAILFIRGRLFFYHVNGKRSKMNSGAPSVLIAYNNHNAKLLEKSGINGRFIKLKE